MPGGFPPRGDAGFSEAFSKAGVYVITFIGLPLALVTGAVLWLTHEGPATDRRFAYGCFESAGAWPVSVGPEGIRLGGSLGTWVAPFKLEYAKGYQLSVGGSFELADEGQRYGWRPTSRGWTYLLRFQGPPKFTGTPAEDPNKLDEFEAVTQDSRRLRFRRTAPGPCPTKAP